MFYYFITKIYGSMEIRAQTGTIPGIPLNVPLTKKE